MFSACSPESETERAVYRGKEGKLLLGTKEIPRGPVGVGLHQNCSRLDFCGLKEKAGSWALTLESLGCEALESFFFGKAAGVGSHPSWRILLKACRPQVSQESV